VSSPAFQFYVRDWIMSTRTLSAEARGVHIDLLAYSWDYNGIPSDPKALASLVMLTPAKFRRVWAELEGRWAEAEKDLLRNPRQERQRAELMDLREKRAAAGRARAAAANGTSK
jgi:uncharacterized protein YdaU (DUF1376 family)